MRTTLATALLLACLLPAAGSELATWETLIAHKPSEKELRAIPSVTVIETGEAKIVLRVENRTGINLKYSGYRQRSPQLFISTKKEGRWAPAGCDWCGTGMESCVVPDKGYATFQLQARKGPVQVFTIFRNAEDAKEFSLVKIYEKEDP